VVGGRQQKGLRVLCRWRVISTEGDRKGGRKIRLDNPHRRTKEENGETREKNRGGEARRQGFGVGGV
jgi:hypothetical protein